MKQQFTPHTCDQADEIRTGCSTLPLHKRRTLWVRILAAILTLLVATSILILTSETSWNIEHRRPNCGNTPNQARAKGCHYEPMLRSWIPSECYTSEPSLEYHPFDDREWFWDKNLTKPMKGSDLDLMRTGAAVVGYTKTFHDEHCLYAWRKLAIAVEKRLPLIDTKTASLHHSTHCSQRIAKLVYNIATWGYNETLDHTSTAPIMFQTCVPLKWARPGWRPFS